MRHNLCSSSAGLSLLIAAWPLVLACSSQASSPGGGTSETSSSGGGVDPASDASANGAGSSSGGGSGISSGSGAKDGGTETLDDASASGQCLASGSNATPPSVTNYVSGVTVSTIAGSGVSGTQDGTGAAAQFSNPTGMAIDTSGNLLVTDYDSGLVRLVTPAGVVTTIAAASNFVDPFASVVSSNGKYYVGTDADNTGAKSTMTGTVWLITPVSGAVATPVVVGQGFGRSRGLAPISGGNLFVVDRTQDVVDQLNVGSGQVSLIAGAAGLACYQDGTGTSAQFNSAVGAATMPDGSHVVADGGNNRIRRVTSAGVVTTLAGTGAAALVDGPCASAAFNAPRAVAADSAENVYVSDIGNHVIRRISPNCTVETIAGNGTAGFNDGDGNAAEFYGQEGIAVTPNGTTIYLADGNGGDGSAYHRVRAISVP
jgi:serine/threonine protein kinase, bacterial